MKEQPLSNNILIWEVKIARDLGELFIPMVNVDQSRSELEFTDGVNTQASDSRRMNPAMKMILYPLCERTL